MANFPKKGRERTFNRPVQAPAALSAGLLTIIRLFDVANKQAPPPGSIKKPEGSGANKSLIKEDIVEALELDEEDWVAILVSN